MNEKYNYVIITTDSLKESLEFFQNWKEYIGYSVTIVTVSQIESTHNGRDTAEKIRNFLVSIYEEWDVQYVLIAGDMNMVPMRYTYQPASSEIAIPSDFYYADLTSDWDTDGDGIYAEFIDDEWPDFSAEVYVGRIPVNNSIDMRRICQKIINYEQDLGLWKNTALLIGAISNFENEQETGDKLGDNAVLMDNIEKEILNPNEVASITLYEKQGLIKSEYDSDVDLTRENSLQYLRNGFGIVNWASHGSATGSYRRWWATDTDGDYTPDLNEIRCEYFITSEDTTILDDTKPFIAFSCSCTNSYPEETNNLGVSLLRNGAVAFIGATRESIYFPGWKDLNDGGNMAINYNFLKHLISENKTIGAALYDALIYSWDFDETPVFRNMLVFNIYGDPSLSLITFSGLPSPATPGIPTGPIQIEPKENITLSYVIQEPRLDELYLIWDFGDGTFSEPLGPFSSEELVSVQHRWSVPGDYQIRIKAINKLGDESEWSQPKNIHVSGPIVTIERVTAGLFTINAEISNNGDRDASSINWTINIDEGTILFGKNTNGVIHSLDTNEKTTIISKFIFGFALSTNITVTVQCSQGSNDKTTVNANVLFSLIRIKGEKL